MRISRHKELVIVEEQKKLAEKIRDGVLPQGPRAIAEPDKELRFTRTRQALMFFGLAVVFFALSMAVFILSTQDWGMAEPLLKGWWWLCLPGLLLCCWMLRLAVRCTRHAYIILSPLGVEIFPFFRARENLQVIYWSQLADAEVVDGQLLLHFTPEKNSGVIASLKPIATGRRLMLEKAVVGVMKNQQAEVD